MKTKLFFSITVLISMFMLNTGSAFAQEHTPNEALNIKTTKTNEVSKVPVSLTQVDGVGITGKETQVTKVTTPGTISGVHTPNEALVDHSTKTQVNTNGTDPSIVKNSSNNVQVEKQVNATQPVNTNLTGSTIIQKKQNEISREVFDTLAPDKKAYITSHPEEYIIVNGNK